MVAKEVGDRRAAGRGRGLVMGRMVREERGERSEEQRGHGLVLLRSKGIESRILKLMGWMDYGFLSLFFFFYFVHKN